MTQQFTANEVRRTACEWPAWRVGDMLHAFADLLEAREKAVPVKLEYYDAGLLNNFGGGNIDWWWDYIRNELGRAHSFYQSQVDGIMSAPSDAERLAEALREFDGTFHKELADLARIPEDDRGRINRSFVMDCVVGLRRCWDKLSAARAHSAQAQPPAARVTDAVFPNHRACVPYENHPGKRIVGFVIDESHPWWGKFGLTEPLFALEAALAAQENPNG